MKLWFEYGPYLNNEVEAPTEDLGKDDILKELASDDDVIEDDEQLLEEDKEVEEDEEENKEEDESDESKDEDEDKELEEVLSPLNRKAILKKYPDVFKDFPQLEKAYFGNQQYRELFPTLDSAKEAVEKIESFEVIENELKSGSSEGLLKALKAEDNAAFGNMVDNYLTNLGAVDSDAYYHVISGVIRNTIIAMNAEAKNANIEDLGIAASIVNQFIFGKKEIEAPTKFAKQVDPKVNEIEKERQKFDQEKLTSHQGDVNNQASSVIKKIITDNIDPKDSMTDYVKRNATREVQDLVTKTLKNDKEFSRYLDKAWDKAKKDKFPPTSIAKIRSAYVSKAKTVLPQIIRKIRNEALQGSGRGKESVEKDRKGRLPVGGSSTPRSDTKGRVTNTIPKGMKTLDFLNF